jgi:ribokinase
MTCLPSGCGVTAMADRPSIVILGSVNLDIVASADRLPVAGETVTGARLARFPGGKGANQALAARRLGADVALVACVGRDPEADAALALLREAGVDLSACRVHASSPTGVALIAVGASGENQIIVAPGANRELDAEGLVLPGADALVCQLEVPLPTIEAAARGFKGFVCLNLAPAREVSEALIRRADLVVVNETEANFYGNLLHEAKGLLARTFGAAGARLSKNGRIVAETAPPPVTAVDTTGAGDAFTAALTVALVEGREFQAALEFACAAGAAAATKAGAQPSLPFRADVERLLRETESRNRNAPD